MTNRTFTLIVFPDGKCLLSTERVLTLTDQESVRMAWESWKKHTDHLLIVGDSKVVMAKEIELGIKDA